MSSNHHTRRRRRPIYERHHEPLASVPRFLARILCSFTMGLVFVGLGLFGGVLGYHFLGDLSWVDALLNASMILSGMGPVDTLPNNAAKVFASLYAIFSGLFLVLAVGIAISPIVHRAMHHFHLAENDLEEDLPRKEDPHQRQ